MRREMAKFEDFFRTIFRGTFYTAALAAVVLLLPIILPIMLCFRIYTFALRAMIAYYSNGDDDVMDGLDAIWLQDSEENHLVIHTLLFLDGQVNIVKMQNLIYNNIAMKLKDDGTKLYDVLTKYANEKFYRCVWSPDKKFDITNHAFQYSGALPANDDELKTVVSNIMSSAMPPNKPSWQYILIPFDGIERSAILFRCHHSIADGMTLLKMFEKSFVDNDTHTNSKKTFGSRDRWKRVAWSLLTGPGLLLERLMWPADDHVLHGQSLSGKKVADWSQSVDLNLIKRIKNVTGTTVNDVLVSCLGGALKKYCATYGMGRGPPENMLAFIPVDLRPQSDPVKTGNQFGCVYLNIPTNISDPCERLDITGRRMARIKQSAEPLVTEVTMDYAMNRFPGFMTRWLFDMIARKYTMVLSNVPGPRDKHTFLGVKINRMVFWPPQRANVGIGISILSYGDAVTVGVEGDTAVLSDPASLCKMFVEAVNQLANQLKLD